MIKACIFDLDGTLTNTLDSLEYSVNETMKEIGMPQITKEQCRQFVGDGAKVLLERTLKAGGDTQLCHLEEAVEAYARIFDANCMYKVAPYEGIPQMLQQLKESGIKLAVLSNKPDRQAVHVVEEVFGKELFDHIQGQKDGLSVHLGFCRKKQHTSEIQKWILQRVMRQRCRQFLCPGDSVEEKLF